MVADADAHLVCQQRILPVLNVGNKDFDDAIGQHPLDLRCRGSFSNESPKAKYVPSIRSASFADIGPRRYMEDEHVRIDDLTTYLGSLIKLPERVLWDPDAAAFVRKNLNRFFFEDESFPQRCEVDSGLMNEIKSSLRKAFLMADLVLVEYSGVSNSAGTTALAAMIMESHLMVANAGDCRAVLCRKGEAIDMSKDHRPTYLSERRRVEELGGFIDDGYLNGVLSVTRALGDWDLKSPRGSPSPLIAEPEFQQVTLTEDDEFLILACDGIWDVMTSQHAVNLVRRGLQRHNDRNKSARDLVEEALRLKTSDILTVVVVCFSSDLAQQSSNQLSKQRTCSLSPEALCSLRSLLKGNDPS